MKRFIVVVFIAVCFGSSGFGQGIDTAAIAMIRDEGLNRSGIMEIMSYLTDVYGPRVTWSPEYREAALWARTRLKEWGLHNVHFDKTGPVGKGWTLRRFSAHVLSPRAFPLIAYPKAWSPGTRGTMHGPVVYLDAKDEEELQRYRGKLKNAFVLISGPRAVSAHFNPQATRLTEAALLEMANAGAPQPGPRRRFADSAAVAKYLGQLKLNANKMEFCMAEGATALLDAGRGDGGTIFVQQASVPHVPKDLADLFGSRVDAYEPDAPKILPQISVAAEHYNRMVRMIEKGQKLTMEVNLEVEFTRADSSFNIIAEIPGTDLKDEVVMIGAHFDSWQAATGATDNATGSAVCMEAIRILQKTGLKPRRTIRMGLWGAEEQGIHGSREYVKEFLGERRRDTTEARGSSFELHTKPAYEKFQVYFNNDNGTGKVRGIYLQGNEGARTIFRSWFQAINDPTAQTMTLSNTGGTDHLSFDAIGLPAFQFIQDPIEYSTRSHHSNMDMYERVQEEDVKQASIIMAVFAYHAAMMEGRFPRKAPASGRQRVSSTE